MAVHYSGKRVVVGRQPAVMYSMVSDLRNIVKGLPEEKQAGVTATEDTLSFNVQGFNVGVKILERTPFNRVVIGQGEGAPVNFQIAACFDTVDFPDNPDVDCQTGFHLEMDVELPAMLKMMIGGKLQGFLDEATDMIARSLA